MSYSPAAFGPAHGASGGVGTFAVQIGKVTPVIDQTYPLSQAREAMRYLETGHARGKIVILV